MEYATLVKRKEPNSRKNRLPILKSVRLPIEESKKQPPPRWSSHTILFCSFRWHENGKSTGIKFTSLCFKNSMMFTGVNHTFADSIGHRRDVSVDDITNHFETGLESHVRVNKFVSNEVKPVWEKKKILKSSVKKACI